MVTFVIRDFVTFAVAWMLAEELAPGHLVTFVEQFIYQPDGGQHSCALMAHPANGGQQIAGRAVTRSQAEEPGCAAESASG
jgi:hypothetical protein